MRILLFFVLLSFAFVLRAQENPYNNPVQTQTQLQVAELVQKKAEYHRLTKGQQDGYRIKLHFGIERAGAESIQEKFDAKFPDIKSYLDYQQPNFVILAGDYKTHLEAFESLRNIQNEFPNAFIVKCKINSK